MYILHQGKFILKKHLNPKFLEVGEGKRGNILIVYKHKLISVLNDMEVSTASQ